MRKNLLKKTLLIAALVLASFSPMSAHAALGDFLYKWGNVFSFSNPRGMAVDSSGNVYVSNSGNYRIEVFSSTGVFLRAWGTFGAGDGQFQGPSGIAVDPAGNVYVVDSSLRNVQIFSNTGTFLRKWGSAGSGDGQFSNPNDIAVDSNGNVYVVEDHTCRVQVFSNTGTFLRKWGSQGPGDGQFQYPSSLAVDSNGDVYVSDTANNRVQVFSNTGTFLRKWGTTGAGDGQFNSPKGIDVDAGGNVHVVDFNNQRVQVFSNAGTFLKKWGSMGTGDGQFKTPWSVAVNAGGNIYVLDYGNYTSNYVQIFDSSGTFINKWTTNSTGNGELNNPSGLAMDRDGNVYVADTYNNRVQVFNNTGTFLRKWGAAGAGDGQFNNPWGIAVDAGGNVYVADTFNNRVQVFTNTGAFLRKWGSSGAGNGQFNYPRGIALDVNGNVYVPDYQGRVQVFSTTGTFLRSFGSMGSGDGQLNVPWGIAIDPNGTVYVTEYNNSRVQVFSNTGAYVRKWGAPGAGDGQFSYPEGIAVDTNGNVFVADTGNNRVQVFTETGTYRGKWGGYGSGNGQFNYPVGAAVDGGGAVFISDFNNKRVQVFEGYRNCVITANAGVDITAEQTSPEGAFVTLDGSGSRQEGCAGALSLAWSWPGGSASGINPIVLVSAGPTTITLTVTSGSQSATDSVVVVVGDTLAPATAALISGMTGTNGWFGSAVAVSLSASDSGSGVKELRYRIDGAESIVSGNAASFAISTEGMHALAYHARDNAGNIEAAHSLAINIDTTPPLIAAVQTPLPNINGWNNADVNVGFTCTDGVSGIGYCTQPLLVVVEGAGQSFFGSAVDNAGNTAGTSVTLNIDKTPPEILISGIADGAVYTPGSVPVPGYEVFDALSGAESHDASLSGASTGNGTVYTYRVNARDKAGNAVSAAATYTVSYGFSGFLEPISLGKPFKLGSTIPVKFRLADAQGNYVPTAIATIAVQQYSGEDPIGDVVILSANGADDGNSFRYDAADNLYIFNLGTKDLVQGAWQIRAMLDDGSVRSAFIHLKKN